MQCDFSAYVVVVKNCDVLVPVFKGRDVKAVPAQLWYAARGKYLEGLRHANRMAFDKILRYISTARETQKQHNIYGPSQAPQIRHRVG